MNKLFFPFNEEGQKYQDFVWCYTADCNLVILS